MKEIRFDFSLVAIVGAAAVIASVVACGATTSSPVHLADPVALTTPTSVGTAPMFAVSAGGKQAVAWVSAPNGGTDGRLYVSVAGSAPSEIRDSLGPIEVHGEAPPKLAYAPDGGLFAVFTVGKVIPGERFPRTALRLVSSHNDGATWSAPITVTDGEPFGSHSFHALHVAANGTIYVSWLGKSDSDTTAKSMAAMGEMSGMSHMAHDHEASAAWITRSTDGGKTWAPRVRVDMGEACPCCRTALATSKDGTLYMAWRHVYPGSVRDIVVARSNDQGATWSEPVRVQADDWKFDACPHAGPAIASDSNGTLHVTWWTGKEGAAGVYYTQSTDGGKTFAPASALGVAQYSRPAHVQLALAPNDRIIVAWDDGTKEVPRVVVRVSSDGGHHFADATTVSAVGRAASFPVLGVSRDSLAIAWSEVSAEAATAAANAAAKTDRKAPKGLEAVGDARVFVRRGVLQ
ncbi:MAG TPA: sialidase family protein [Gemmatimonadaceae bacterium]|jgi:BNR repeat-like domain|nr:sialidase family protein [Gemmatimonadaceae bacterium]